MSGHEKDADRKPQHDLDLSLQAKEKDLDDVGPSELEDEPVFLHPRFDPSHIFIQHHQTLAQGLAKHPYPGILAAVADPEQIRITWIAATSDDVRAAIIGRHSRSTLALPQEHATAALRHMILLVHADDNQPIARLLDLQTESGFANPLGRRIESIRTNGATFLSVAGTVLMLIPTGPDRTLDADPQTAWNNVPAQRWIETRRKNSLPLVPKSSPRKETIVEMHNGPQGCRSSLCRGNEVPLGLATIAANGQESHLRISARALDEGFLIGRYDRCEVGGPEADESLSRVHLLIVREKQKIIAIDTASTNGTFMGEERVHLMQLKEGSTLDLGGVLEFTWRLSN